MASAGYSRDPAQLDPWAPNILPDISPGSLICWVNSGQPLHHLASVYPPVFREHQAKLCSDVMSPLRVQTGQLQKAKPAGVSS